MDLGTGSSTPLTSWYKSQLEVRAEAGDVRLDGDLGEHVLQLGVEPVAHVFLADRQDLLQRAADRLDQIGACPRLGGQLIGHFCLASFRGLLLDFSLYLFEALRSTPLRSSLDPRIRASRSRRLALKLLDILQAVVFELAIQLGHGFFKPCHSFALGGNALDG